MKKEKKEEKEKKEKNVKEKEKEKKKREVEMNKAIQKPRMSTSLCKKNEIRGGPLLYIIGICRGGRGVISIIINHHDSTNAKFHGIL
jgi:hypothetical protein